MEKTVKININIKVARSMLELAGFWKLAETGTDDEIFMQVLDMMTCYGTTTEIVDTSNMISADAAVLLNTIAIMSAPTSTREEDGGVGVTEMLPFDMREDCMNDEIAF